MAGLSSRFSKAGYTLPKYMLYIYERSLFYISVSSFKKYFDEYEFLFIARDVFCTKDFITQECILLGIKNFNIEIVEPTKGQAETVLIGITQSKLDKNESILIFNIDTFRPNFIFPKIIDNCDGYLEVFIGSGANWSYAKTENENSTRVIETAEKKEISQYCSTGIYYFKSVSLFIEAYKYRHTINLKSAKEEYIAPLYNFLIMKDKNIQIEIIKRYDVQFCGIPDEYIEFIKKIAM